MKVSKAQTNPNQVNFKGMKKTKNQYGEESYKFYLPYDTNKYKAYVELIEVREDKNYNWHQAKNAKIHRVQFENKQAVVDPFDYFDEDQDFAYRFKLVGDDKTMYHNDAGVKAYSDTYDFSVIKRNRAGHNKPGQMMHVMPDNYFPGYVFDKSGKIEFNKDRQEKATKAVRTHFNQLGGSIAGIMAGENLDKLKDAGVHNVLSTPIFGMDELSSHGYWTTNPYQVSTQNGTMKNFKDFQVELFKRDMNLVADGAFVNEGLEGTHFKHVLKWGDKSPYANWFKAYSLGSGPLKLGVIPKDEKARENVRLKVVNAPYNYTFSKNKVEKTKNEKYDSSQPTFVQLYDNRLVSDEQKKSNEIIRKYDKLNTEDHHEIMNHNDSVLLYAFEVDPKTLSDNISKMDKKHSDKNSMSFVEGVLHFDNFIVGGKEDGGFYTWDGNIDIAKLNYMYSNQDEAVLDDKGVSKHEKKEIKQNIIKGGYQVQDYIQKVGSFWTQATKNTLVEYTANQIKGADKAEEYTSKIKDLAGKDIPETAKEAMGSDNSDVIKNILDEDYVFPQDEANEKELLVSSMMDYPLDAIEFAPDLTGVLASPYITKRAFTKEDIGKDRLETYKVNYTSTKEASTQKKYDFSRIPEEYRDTYETFDKVYHEQMEMFARQVLKGFNENSSLKLSKEEGSDVTEAGKFLVPLISSDIVRYAMVKSLAPDAVKVENDEVKYDLGKLRKTGIKKLHLSPSNPQEEAMMVAKKVKKGIYNIKESEAKAVGKALAKRFEGVDLNDIKVATAIVDRTESGLNWRIDATKDVADIDHIRNGNDDVSKEWDKVIDFWKGFTNQVRKENPNSYIIAEMTDMGDFHKYKNGDSNDGYGKFGKVKFDNAFEAEKKFVQETGMSTLSNYSHFFSNIPRLEGKTADANHDSRQDNLTIKSVRDGVQGLLNSSMVNASNHSHNFFSNHDKPRILHTLAVDMDMYHQAELKGKYQGYVDRYSGEKRGGVHVKAITTAKRLEGAFDNVLKEKNGGNEISDAFKYSFVSSMRKFVNSPKHESFGTKPFDVVIHDALENYVVNIDKYTGDNAPEGAHISEAEAKLVIENKDDIENQMFKRILEPAMKKYQRMAKILEILPGNPTTYAGDELGSTGFETPNKNIYVQNRNALRWDWINKESGNHKQFVEDHYNEMQTISKIRKNDDLSALSTGETLVCGTANENETLALLRYDDKSTLLCLATDSASNKNIYHSPGPVNINTGKIELKIAGGIGEGTEFETVNLYNDKNYKPEKYTVYNENGKFYLGRIAHHKNGDSYIDGIQMKDTIAVLKKVEKKGTINHKGYGNKGSFLKAQAYLGSYQVDNRSTVAVY